MHVLGLNWQVLNLAIRLKNSSNFQIESLAKVSHYNVFSDRNSKCICYVIIRTGVKIVIGITVIGALIVAGFIVFTTTIVAVAVL